MVGQQQQPRWSRRHAHWLAALILVAAGVEFLDAVRAAWAFTTDDAYISLRYAQHLVDGHGLAWNSTQGPLVEGYSNFTFVGIAAAALATGLDPVVTLKILSVAATLLACASLYLLARLHAGPILATVPAVMLLAFPGTAWWAVSGLETLFFVMLAVVATTVFAYGLGRRPCTRVATPRSQPARPPILFLAGFVVAVAGLTRPEAPLLGIAMVVALYARHRQQKVLADTVRLTAALAAGFLLLYVPYFTWRIAYFAHLLPNTVSCKAGYDGDPWQLILGSAPLLGLTLAASIPALRRRAEPENLVAMSTAGLYVVALYGVEPTVGYLSRHFMAAFALMTVPALAGLAVLMQRRTGSLRASTSLVVVLCIKTGFATLLMAGGANMRLAEFASKYQARSDNRRALARWLNFQLAPGAAYVHGDVGLTGYLTNELNVIDAYCLNNPKMTQGPPELGSTRLVRQVFETQPAAVVVASKSATTMHSRSGQFRSIMRDPTFDARYQHVRTFAPIEADDAFNYWVYLRRDLLDRDDIPTRTYIHERAQNTRLDRL